MPTTTDIERRTVPVRIERETRADGKLRLRGLAAVFDSPSEDLGFREVLEPGAFTDALRTGDPLLLWQHDTSKPLARRSAGNLTLTETGRGLEFEATLPETSTAKDALELVRAGIVKSMSFAFGMADGRDRWEQREGKPWRFIEKVGRLFEISLVSEPAYAATSVEARANVGRLKVRERDAYGPGSPFSYFRDLAAVQMADGAAQRAREGGMPVGSLNIETFATLGEKGEQGGIPEARKRLATIEHRDVTTADPGAGVFVPPTGSVPAFVAELFATAAHAQANLLAALPSQPLPAYGMDVTVPRVDVAPTVTVNASQGDPVSETDFDGAAQASKVAYIAGQSDMSRQAFDRSGPALDTVLAKDLGRALGAAIDVQLATGTNANQQTLGLASVTGIKTVAYTDASPTAQEFVAKLWAAYNAVATDGYGISDPAQFATLLHPRRIAWLYANAQNAQTIRPQIPGTLVPCGGLRATLGAGTNEDEAFVILPSELTVFLDPPRFLVQPDVLSGTLEIRVQAIQAIATSFGRAPGAICRLSGTGLVSPAL